MTLKELIQNVNVIDMDREILVAGDYIIVGKKADKETEVKRINNYDEDKEFYEERY